MTVLRQPLRYRSPSMRPKSILPALAMPNRASQHSTGRHLAPSVRRVLLGAHFRAVDNWAVNKTGSFELSAGQPLTNVLQVPLPSLTNILR
jgi:hypothetical protein